MKQLLLFIACIPAFAQIPANWNQKFWQFNISQPSAYIYNSGCTGTDCANAVKANMSLSHAVAGDVWSSTWPFDNNQYSCADDNFGANYSGTTPNISPGGHNLSIMKITGNPFDGTLAITDQNTMSDYGGQTQGNTNGWTDNRVWKCTGGGMHSITYSGVHYMLEWVTRQSYADNSETNASLISTTDNWAHVSNAYGVTNSATGAAPVSPNSLINTAGFTAPSFVDFGLQDGACPPGLLADCANFLYGTAIGHWTGVDTNIYSWRFPVADVANLAALSTDLQWFNSAHAGCNTASVGFQNCWDVIGNATAIYTASSAILSMVPMTYIASSQKYIMMEFYYVGGLGSTSWPALECNSVVGPCSLNIPQPSFSSGNSVACYNAQIDDKHSDFQSRALVITYACNYGTALNSPATTLYTLYYNTVYLPPARKPIAISSLNNDRALPANGLKLLYDMIHDWGAPGLTDYSGGGNNYTLAAPGTAWAATPAGVVFNGTANIQTSLSSSWTALTFGGLVLATGVSPKAYERFLDQGGSTAGFWFGRNNTTANAFECGVKQTGSPFGGTFTLADGVSHLVMCGWNGTAQSLYISGAAAALGSAAPGAAPVAATNLYFGGDTSNDYLKGTEYVLPIWNRALSATEQSRVYKAIYDAAISVGVTP